MTTILARNTDVELHSLCSTNTYKNNNILLPSDFHLGGSRGQIRDGYGAGLVRLGPGPGPGYFFMDSDPDLDPDGPKFSDPDPYPTDLMGLRSLMSLIQSLFDSSKLNLLRVFLYFYKQLIIVLQTFVRVHKIQIQNNYQNIKTLV